MRVAAELGKGETVWREQCRSCKESVDKQAGGERVGLRL